jgi:hypothetical protein
MILVSKTYWSGAPFNFRAPPAAAALESLVLRAADARELRALYWTPAANPRPAVAVVAMHPRVDFTHHYTFPRLVAAGIACLGANSRNPNNDSDTEHESLILDVAACVNFLRKERGVENVILLGNSGGGSLSAFFQAQARLPSGERIARTPAGGRTMLPIADLAPADGMIYVSAHRGQGVVLGECIDPSVVDEHEPLGTDSSLDMYDARNGFRPPPSWSEYPDEFVARFREAQKARVLRLDTTARALIADGRAAAEQEKHPGFSALPFEEQQRILQRAAFEPVMVIYRTMANLNYTDRRLDPSGREYGSLLSDRPDLMNMALLGFGRICTPRAWLSTWSAISSNADLIKNLRVIAEPTLIVNAGRDREIYPKTDAKPIFDAVASRDRTFLEFEGARHYFEPDFGQKEAPDVERLMDKIVPWILDRFNPFPRSAARATPKVERHPTTSGWQFPPSDRPPLPGKLQRTNLRDLIARPGRFEHHLMVVASLGVAQFEAVTASEPLYFTHRNISDEYALAMLTGDAMIDAFPLRTFISDFDSGEDVGRVNHRAGDLVMHPYGLLHWPGKLRPPYAPIPFPPGMRKTGLSLVYCASKHTPPRDRPLFVSAGREADAKAYGPSPVPFLLADTAHDPTCVAGAIGDTTLQLLVAPARIAPARGGFLAVLEASAGSAYFAGDLVRIPPGEEVPAEGIARALLLSSPSAEPDPAPPSWAEVPLGPFPTFEEGERGTLPFQAHGLSVEAASGASVRVALDQGGSGEVPRYWLARMLFRMALHGYRLGYLETYGGFYSDDSSGDLRIGLRGRGHVTIPRGEAPAAVERLYRAVAPEGYTERLS